MEIGHDGARVDSFLRGKFLGLVKINKLEQLRKYIFNIEIERIQFEQVKKKLLELVKLFRSKVDPRESTIYLYDSLMERNKTNWYVAAIFETIKDPRSNV